MRLLFGLEVGAEDPCHAGLRDWDSGFEVVGFGCRMYRMYGVLGSG